MRLRRLLPFTWVLLAACPSLLHGRAIEVPASNETPHDSKGYLEELDKWSAAAERLEAHPEEAASLERALPKNWPVAVGGQSFQVDTGWLRAELADFESDPGHAAKHSREMLTRLRVMRNAAESMTAALPVADTAARPKLDEILRRRQFRDVRPSGALRTGWQRLWDWIASQIDLIFGGASRHPNLSRTLVWTLTVLFGLLVVGWVANSLRSFRRTRPRMQPSAPVQAGGSSEWSANALARASEGNYREAIHLAYWAGVYRLGETGLWKVDGARTPREYLRLLPGGHQRRTRLQELTDCFERVWYAGRVASAEDFRAALALLEDLGCPLAWNRPIAAS
jgi:hypothetical protein